MTITELSREIKLKLQPKYGLGETRAMINLIFYALKDWNPTDIIIKGDMEASDWLQKRCNEIISRLQSDEPIQYILGETSFLGFNLKVTQDTLIPRPETETLIDIILDKFKGRKDMTILDIGTGSGAIAIALAANIPFSKVTAIDISEKAIEVAKENAKRHHQKINFIIRNLFDMTQNNLNYDLIVSNPPYIDESEKSDMEPNVLNFEPHSALFVPDSNPLIFYRDIWTKAANVNPIPSLAFEINPRHAAEMAEKICKLKKWQSENIEIIKDIHGKERFIFCKGEA